MRWRRVLGGLGRVLIAAGVLVLLFVGYQLWGTGLREAQAQRSLESEFTERVDDRPASDPTPRQPSPVPEGDALARIRMPDIGVDKIVVEGVGLEDLKRGPGHYPGTPLPGQPGNAAIAGHRTTYGAPFNRIDELDPGAEIELTTEQGTFVYEVSEQLIVEPDQVEVLDDFDDNRITLTACHPKYSAAQRIVVVGQLVGEAATAPEGPTASPTPAQGNESATSRALEAGLDGEEASRWPAALLAVSCVLIWLAAWLLGALWRKWPAYLLFLPVFLVMLFFFFESFSRLLPANF
ncbi:MAG TPA: class E sortase [Acidimicrobiales bacterium]